MSPTNAGQNNPVPSTTESPGESQATQPIALKPEQAADYLGVSPWMVYKLMEKNHLANYHIGRLRRIPIEAVRAYQAKQLAKAGFAVEAA